MSQEKLQDLLRETCLVHGKAVALEQEAILELIKLNSGWELNPDSSSIQRIFKFKDYHQTIAFVNAVAWIANQQDHHPDMNVSYNRCTVTYSTHSVGGLSRNDFICAARINQLFD